LNLKEQKNTTAKDSFELRRHDFVEPPARIEMIRDAQETCATMATHQ
jgi:hypothetical protein